MLRWMRCPAACLEPHNVRLDGGLVRRTVTYCSDAGWTRLDRSRQITIHHPLSAIVTAAEPCHTSCSTSLAKFQLFSDR